jgi:hypothetical protein
MEEFYMQAQKTVLQKHGHITLLVKLENGTIIF